MSSFAQSQPIRFSPYTPTIDSQTLGKALSLKDQEYQQGAKKVQATVDQVAGLPVLTGAEKDYLTGKVKAITTDINNKVGTDFSNLNQVNTIAGHVSSIANDPIIQRAISNVSTARTGNERQKENQDENGADATKFNDEDWEEKLGNFQQSGKLGDAFKGNYIPYHDLDGGIQKYLSKLHPFKEVKEDVSGSGTSNMGDIKKYTISGIDPSIVKKEVETYLNTTPGAKDQIGVNSKGFYKGYTDIDFAKRSYEVNTQRQAQLKNEIQKKVLLNAKISDIGMKNSLNDEIMNLSQENSKLGTHDYRKDAELFNSNPEYFKNELYQREFITGQVGKYAYGGSAEEEYLGESPWTKTMQLKNYLLKVHQDTRASEEHGINMEIKRAKLNGITSPGDVPVYGSYLAIQPEDKNQAWNNYTRDIVQEGLGVTQSEIDFMANKMKLSGVKNFEDIFSKDENGHYIISNKGVDGILGKSGKPVSQKDYYLLGYDDKDGKYHPGVITDWTEKAKRNDYGPDEKGFKLTNHDISSLVQFNKKDQEYKAGLNQMTAIRDKAANDPMIKDLNHKIDYLNQNPISTKVQDEHGNTINTSYTGQNVLDYVDADNELHKRYLEETKGMNQKEDGPAMNSIYNSLKSEIFPKHGLNNNQVKAIANSPTYSDIANHYSNAAARQTEILNKEALDRGYVYQPFSEQWTRGYRKDNPAQGQLTDNTILTNVENYLNSTGVYPSGTKEVLAQKGSTVADKPQAQVTWNGNTKKYNIVLSSGKIKSSPIEVDEAQAQSLGIPVVKPKEDHIFKIMTRFGGHTFPVNEGPTLQNAVDLVNIGKYVYKVHVIDNGDNYTIMPYKVNSQAKPGEKQVETLEDVTTPTHDWNKVSGYLENLIYGAKPSYNENNPIEDVNISEYNKETEEE